jgi:histidinol-phosphate phosphatase family protein
VDNGYVLSFESFEFNGPLIEALARHSASLRTPVVVISNQRCVSKDLISQNGLRDLMKSFTNALVQSGLRLSAWYCCPHGYDDDCPCRKPRPGMIDAAAFDFGFDLRRSCIIGDSDTDLVAGAAGGIGTCIRYCMERRGDTERVTAILEALYGT